MCRLFADEQLNAPAHFSSAAAKDDGIKGLVRERWMHTSWETFRAENPCFKWCTCTLVSALYSGNSCFFNRKVSIAQEIQAKILTIQDMFSMTSIYFQPD